MTDTSSLVASHSFTPRGKISENEIESHKGALQKLDNKTLKAWNQLFPKVYTIYYIIVTIRNIGAYIQD